jgi:hypothetical protein
MDRDAGCLGDGEAVSTPAEMLACAEREVKMRERVYPNLVKRGKMSLPQSDYEIRTMESIAEHFRKMVKPQMFDDNGEQLP